MTIEREWDLSICGKCNCPCFVLSSNQTRSSVVIRENHHKNVKRLLLSCAHFVPKRDCFTIMICVCTYALPECGEKWTCTLKKRNPVRPVNSFVNKYWKTCMNYRSGGWNQNKQCTHSHAVAREEKAVPCEHIPHLHPPRSSLCGFAPLRQQGTQQGARRNWIVYVHPSVLLAERWKNL